MDFFGVWSAFMAGLLVNGIVVRIDHPEVFGNTIVYPASMLALLIVAALLYEKIKRRI